MYNTCPSFDTLARFANATLADHDAAKIVTHLAACETCSRKVDELEHRSEQPMLAALRNLQNEPIANDDPPLPKTIGQYEILEKIGQGGMGTVYRAVHPHLKREVALKVIRDSRLDDPAARERFVQEMQALGRLAHPNIVHATDAGIDGDIPFIVTELLDGEDLGTWIAERGKMPVKRAVGCIRQAATGLAYAHKAGYVHRDIKPSNLFLLRDGTVKILDLGIARPMGDDRGQTVTGHVVGSPDFMAPEQFRGGAADARSDIYSLGQTFLYIMTGKHDDVSGFPLQFKRVLVRMTAGTPSQRYQTVDGLLMAIDAASRKPVVFCVMMASILLYVAICLLWPPPSSVPIVEPLPLPTSVEVTTESLVELPTDVETKIEDERRAEHMPEHAENLRRMRENKISSDRFKQEMADYKKAMAEWEKTGKGEPPIMPDMPDILPPVD